MSAWCQSYLSSRNTSVNLYELEMELEVRREWSRLLKSFVFWMWKIEPEEEREATWRRGASPGSGTKGSWVLTLSWPLYTLSSWGRWALR